jgi:hypothetical protein
MTIILRRTVSECDVHDDTRPVIARTGAVIPGIDADQIASIAFHAKHGFVEVGRLRQVGFKFGRWLDVCYMQLMLA